MVERIEFRPRPGCPCAAPPGYDIYGPINCDDCPTRAPLHRLYDRLDFLLDHLWM